MKAATFFRGVHWDKLEKKLVPAPFVPAVEGEHDTANFDDM